MLAPRTIIVGELSALPSILNPPQSFGSFGLSVSLRPDFDSIQDAIDYAHRELQKSAGYPDNHNFVTRYTILVLPGVYKENITCYPWINLLGLARESTWLIGPDTNKPTIALADFVNVTNLSILMVSGGTELGPAAIVGGDFLKAIHGIGLTNVDVFPAGGESPSFQRALELNNSNNAIITTFQASYFGGRSGRACVEVRGPFWWEATTLKTAVVKPQGWTAMGWNADTHFINCFVDAIQLDEFPDSSSASVGCMLTRNCFEVHVRGSFLRSGPDGSALNVQCEDLYPMVALNPKSANPYGVPSEWGHPLVNVLVEGTTLYDSSGGASPRVLRVGPRTQCLFNHSSASSISVPPDPSEYFLRPALGDDAFAFDDRDTEVYGRVTLQEE